MVKAVADATSNAESPQAEAAVWIESPEQNPAAAIKAGRRPCDIPLARTYMMSGPGAIASAAEVRRKVAVKGDADMNLGFRNDRRRAAAMRTRNLMEKNCRRGEA